MSSNLPEHVKKFPHFAFALTKVKDDSGELEIPAMRVWMNREVYFDLNVDSVIEAFDKDNFGQTKIIQVEIFNNDESRTMIVYCDQNTKYYECHISRAFTEIKGIDDIEYKGAIGITDMAFHLTLFMNFFHDWLESQFDKDGKNINAK